jgi:hypothetical protein
MEPETSDDSEESEEEEPQLKYHRLNIEVLKSDMATCAYAADKFLILGTKTGEFFNLMLINIKVMFIFSTSMEIKIIRLS